MHLYNEGTHTAGDPSTWFRFFASGRYPFHDLLDTTMQGAIHVPIAASPTTGSSKTMFEVTWASRLAPAGFVYDVQIRRPSETWADWKHRVSSPRAAFQASHGLGIYRFRGRLVRVSDGSHSVGPDRDRSACPKPARPSSRCRSGRP